ncbi:MAG: septation regulator SpoVG [candidate division Zixibacteria bacterium]|nr:septation regulator SpoVG [candidate division Zixibacteria bacterium]
MEITEVRITLRDEDKLKAFANVTFDQEFVIRGLKIINGTNGYFVSMPSRKRADGTHQDIAHPINNQMRQKIETAVIAAYEQELKAAAAGRPSPPDDHGEDH